MITSGLRRILATTGLAVSLAATAAPAFAAQADLDLLHDYLGDWKGRGTLTGANVETVVCRISLSSRDDTKLNYSGRCVLAGNNLAINGTIAYIDAKQRYEAIMTSNAAFTGVAIGRKQRGGVVFNLSEKDRAEDRDVTVTAGISLLNGTIEVDFRVVDDNTGDQIHAEVPFSR